MNMYELSRQFWDYAFINPDKVKPHHVAIYFFAIEHCNRLGWKKKFGIPTSMVMEATGIKSYRTYKNHFDELIDYGFFTIIEFSKNQFSSNIIALNFKAKALDKALDKALTKHASKQGESTVSIDKQVYNNTIIQIYNLYPSICPTKKTPTGKSAKDKDKIKSLIDSIGVEKLKSTIEKYVKDCEKGKVYMKNFKTFLNNLPDYDENHVLEEEKDLILNPQYLTYWRHGSIEKDKTYMTVEKYEKTVKKEGYLIDMKRQKVCKN